VNNEENSLPSTSPSLDSGQQMLLIAVGLASLTESMLKMTNAIDAMLEQNNQVIGLLIQKERDDEAEDELPPPMNSRPS
jgi:hypothetical protein